MIWRIARKDFLLNLMTFKFAAGTAVCVVLMAVFMPVLVSDYQQRRKDHDENVAANEAELHKVKVYCNITPVVFRSPCVLSVFNAGSGDQTDGSEQIDMDVAPDVGAAISAANPLLSVFPALDVTLVFRMVASILAILLAYDALSGEREEGTLKLILSGAVARHQVLLGKLTAGLMTLAVPVTVSFLVGLLIFLPSHAISVTGAQWLRIGAMYLASMFLVAVMFCLGLLLSCLSRTSAVSLVLGLLLWLLVVTLLPNASASIASRSIPIESPNELAERLRAVKESRDEGIRELTAGLKKDGTETTSDVPGAFGRTYTVLCNKSAFVYRRQTTPITEPVKLEYVTSTLELKEAHFRHLIRQKRLTDTLAGVSPTVLYENLMCIAAGTDPEDFRSFKTQVRAYRREVVDYIRAKTDNFTSTSYFTPCREGDYERLMETYYRPYMEAQDKDQKAKIYQTAVKRYDQLVKETPSLDLANLPRFTCLPRSVTASFLQAMPIAGLLIFEGILSFALSFVAFLTYDVR
jgi:ABC-type transport system involved in multi-copper enzyme maturation permease subunit